MLSLLLVTRRHGESLLLRTVSTVSTASLTRKILQEKKYRALQESLQDQEEPPSALLSIGRFVLKENIRVARQALELDDILYFPKNSQIMDKRGIVRAANRHGFHIPAEIKISRFTAKEDSVILTNWNQLQVRTGLKHGEAEKMFVKSSSSDCQTELRCKILAAFYLSQGLPNIRIPCEVFHRAKSLSIKTGEFTSEEDQTIEDFVSTHGRKWSQLAKILNRNEHSVLNRYDGQIKQKNTSRRGQFSLEEDLKILQFMFSNCGGEVLERNVKYYQLSHQLGLQLDRKPAYVHGHWLGVIQPLLTRDCSPEGCLEVDYTTILINHMVDNDLKYSQHVRWEDLVKSSEFEGEEREENNPTFHYFYS